MNTIERNELLLEKREVLIIHRRGEAHTPFCAECGNLAILMTLEEATATSGLSMRLLCRLVEAGQLHFIETPKGILLLCSDTLFKAAAAISKSLSELGLSDSTRELLEARI